MAFFSHRDFFITKDVLIPRIETEEIIDLVCCSGPDPESIADVGCGSGCIGITLAEKYPQATVYLSDISKKALAITRQNIKTKNIVVLFSNLLTHYPPNLLFDVIVANLPYVPTSRIPTLDPGVKDCEPHLALDGGPKGATLINKLLRQLPAHLAPNGQAILEIDDTHTLKTFKIPKSFEASIKKDQFGRNRFLILQKKYI